jgi:hypothetical protein
VVGKTAAPPSSATTRGVEISRVASSRKTSTYMHQCVGAHSHMLLSPLTPREFGGGCMALAPHLRMVVWLHKFWLHLPEKYNKTVNPAEFLQIYSTSILATGGNEVILTNYFPVALTRTTRSWLMNPPRGDPRFLVRAVPPVHRQLRECLYSARQQDQPPRHPTTPGGISVLLRPTVLPGSQYHSSYLQCFYGSCISPWSKG